MFRKAVRLDLRMNGFVFAGIVPPLPVLDKERQVSEVELNEKFAKLRVRYETLKEQVANQIEMYSHLVETEGPNIEAQYMMSVGHLECTAARLELEVMRWRRRFVLRQMYLNKGEKPDMVAIEAQLDREFAEWCTRIDGMVERLGDSKLWFDSARLSEAETNAIRCAYLNAVKKLHPDLNKGQSEAAVSLWNQIQKAYSAKNWRQLEFLVSLVDDVVAGEESFDETPDGLAKLRAGCRGLEAKMREVTAQIEELKLHVPFSGVSRSKEGGTVSLGPPCGPEPRLAQLDNANATMTIYIYHLDFFIVHSYLF